MEYGHYNAGTPRSVTTGESSGTDHRTLIRGQLNVLCIEPTDLDFERTKTAVESTPCYNFAVRRAQSMSEAAEVLADEDVHIILSDIALPDIGGLDTVQHLHDLAPKLPLVVFSARDEEELALQAVRKGAQDVLVKGRLDLAALPRILAFAFERQALQERLKDMTLRDELTGLYNQRGFYALAGEFAEVARNGNRGLHILFIDLDGLKAINDAHGHSEGSRAIMAAGGMLENVFREHALLARWGGDEFVVLLIEGDDTSEAQVTERIEAALIRFNTRMRRGYDLSMSIGFAKLEPDDPRAVEELLREADKAMYENKRIRKTLRKS